MRSVVSLFSGDVRTENTRIPVRGVLHGTLLCSAPARQRVRTLRIRHRDTRATYSGTRQTNHSGLGACTAGHETSVCIRRRGPMILDITIGGYGMWSR